MLIMGVATLQAQTDYMEQRTNARGLLFNRDLMTIADMCNLSSSSYSYGTARSAGLSGAMTSLGGDASSSLINPAGLGMYRSNEFSFSPIYMASRSDVSGSSQLGDNKTNRGAISNMSVVMMLYQSGKTKVTAINFGFSYNRTSSYNEQYTISTSGSSSSVANMFSRQLTESQTPLSSLYGSNNPDWSYMSTNLWGAALGYKTGLTFQTQGDVPSDYYDTSSGGSESQNYRDPVTESSDIAWNSTWVDSSATVDQTMTYVRRGSAGEYGLSLGGNISNQLYFGMTLGVQSVREQIDLYYDESYNNPSSFSSTNKLTSSSYNQTIIMSGVGINFKMGLTYRIEDLRIAMAYHTPTSYSFNREYQTSVYGGSTFTESNGSVVTNNLMEYSPVLEDSGVDSWGMNMPSKLLFGGSYVIHERALVSVDYQIDFYKGMKMKETPTGVAMSVYSGISDLLNNQNSCRVGVEYKLSPLVTLRGGYGFTSELINESDESAVLLWDMPVDNKSSNFSAGVGFMLSMTSYFDIAYVNQTTTQTEYALFWADGTLSSEAPSAASARSQRLTNKLTDQWVVATMRFKF